jgi:outer membrane protein assembly factor BamA
LKTEKHLTIVNGKLLLVLLFSCLFLLSFTQENEVYMPPPLEEIKPTPSTAGWLILRNIIITGNKKTKDYIIKREMQLKGGDSILISTLTNQLTEIRKNIYNTTLFVTVKVEPILLNAFELDIIVTVKERLYIFPIPQFQLADRSFDEWLVKYKGSLRRVNYGIKFAHYNVSGRKDQFRLFLINGYTRNISASYNAPYSNAKLTHGFYAGAGFSQDKEIAYKTNYDNSFAFYKDGGFVRTYWYLEGGYIIRKAIKKREIFSVNYSHVEVSDSIIKNNLNAGYFNNNANKKGYIDLGYTIQYIDVNNILYPLEGISGHVSVQKRGLGLKGGINMLSVEGQYNKFNALGKGWYSSVQFAGKIKLPFDQPFINQRALGDKNSFLRGLEYYTIDGVAFATAKFNLKKELINFTIPTFFKSKTYNKIPFRFFGKVFSDLGYVYSKENPATRLNNKFLSTAGIGLDILTLYDIHIRLDYSLNQLGQKRIVVNNRSGF